MSCRLASASSGMLHSVVNHCPSPPLYPGGLPLSLSAGLKALFLVGTESELRDIQYFTTSLLSGMLCQTFSYVFWIIYIYIYIYYFQKTETVQKNSRQEKRSQRKMWQQCAWVTWRTFKNILLQKGNHQLQPCFWQMRLENRSHQKCALPSEKPWAIEELFPKYFQHIEYGLICCGFFKEKDPSLVRFHLWGWQNSVNMCVQ